MNIQPIQSQLENDCPICCESYTLFAKYGCSHEICYKCASRLFYLYKDMKCPICKEAKTKPVFDSREMKEASPLIFQLSTMSLESSNQNKQKENFKTIKKSDVIEDNCALFKNKLIFSTVKNLLSIKCKECEQVFLTKKELISHFKAHHSALLCYSCVENNHQFWYEFSTYTPETLSLHRKGLLKEPGFDGHVFCPFCAFYLYNKETAKLHCNQEHQICTACDILGLKFQFFKHFEDLETHYRSQHFCCNNKVCLNNHCYVYAYKSELWAHSLSHHGIELQLSEINQKNEKNPQVFSLFDKKSADSGETSIYSTGVNILNPLINEPFFPTFTGSNSVLNKKKESQTDSKSSSVPSFLNRDIIHQEDEIKTHRLNQIKAITPAFSSEIATIIDRFITKSKTLKETVCEIEECVGSTVCLRILDTVSFQQRQKEVQEFKEKYKQEIKFPSFKKEGKKQENSTPAKKGIGYKVLYANKPK